MISSGWERKEFCKERIIHETSEKIARLPGDVLPFKKEYIYFGGSGIA
jgi:hypothetical protein